MLHAALIISGHQIDHLLGRWGYALVFAVVLMQASGVPVPGTTALILAATYAGSTHHLVIAGVVAAASVAAVVGYGVSYGLGRRGGWNLLTRYGHHLRLTPERLRLGRYLFMLHGGKVVFFGRFVTGLRTWGGFLAGATRMSPARFLVFNLLGGLAWATSNGLGYFYFGHAIVNASTPVNVALWAALLASFAATVVYARRRGTSLRLAAERAFPEPVEP
jgi:membrane protein DedA with SNARE-associated domain